MVTGTVTKEPRDVGTPKKRLFSPTDLAQLHRLEAPLYDPNSKKLAGQMARANIASPKRELHIASRPFIEERKSWQEIKNAVSEHIRSYGDGALIVVLANDPRHIWGAIPKLEAEEKCVYIPVAPVRIDDKYVEIHKNIELRLSQDRALVDRIDQDLNGVNDFYAKRSSGPAKNVIVGDERLPPYGNRENPGLYSTLEDFVRERRPSSILIIEQDADFVTMTKNYNNFVRDRPNNLDNSNPRDRFLMAVGRIEQEDREGGNEGKSYVSFATFNAKEGTVNNYSPFKT